MKNYQKFILKHNDYFIKLIDEAEDIRRIPYMGSGLICYPKDFFESIVYNKSHGLLPFALLYIFFGQNVPEDEKFSINGLKELWEMSTPKDPTTGYIYAFCLNDTERYEESLEILSELAEVNYLPAIATLADLHLSHDEINEAINIYEHVISNGYWPIRNHYIHLRYQNSSILGKMKKSINWAIFKLMFYFYVYKSKGLGEKVTYINFYSIKFNKHGKRVKFTT